MSDDRANRIRMYARTNGTSNVCFFFNTNDQDGISIAFDNNADASPIGYLTRNSIRMEDGVYNHWVTPLFFLETLASYLGYRLVPINSERDNETE